MSLKSMRNIKCTLLMVCFVFLKSSFGQQGNNSTSVNSTACSVNETISATGRECSTCLLLSRDDCPLLTETRCYCNQGYVRDPANNCILQADCPTTGNCGGNSTFSSGGSNCFTCDNFQNARCPYDSRQRCYCDSGFVLNDDIQCVRPGDCPKFDGINCRPNQTYSYRGYDCLTCNNYMTDQDCVITNRAQCFCNTGYVRDTRSERCFLPRDCPRNQLDSCSLNETLGDYGYDCATCTTIQPLCPLINQRRCYCLNGYVRNSRGECISPSDCFQSANGNDCGNPATFGCNPRCVRTCRQTDTAIDCPTVCKVCECPAGQVRDQNGYCIDTRFCPYNPYNFPHFNTNP